MGKFPNIIGFLHAPVLSEPPLASLSDLQNGTYSLRDLYTLNEILELKKALKSKNEQ